MLLVNNRTRIRAVAVCRTGSKKLNLLTPDDDVLIGVDLDHVRALGVSLLSSLFDNGPEVPRPQGEALKLTTGDSLTERWLWMSGGEYQLWGEPTDSDP
jgi:hypothetical protein